MSSPSDEHLPPTSAPDSLRQSSSQHTSGVTAAGAAVTAEFSMSADASVMTEGQRVIVMTPVDPSTRILMPLRMTLVASPVPTTAGMPYSRQTIAAWLMTPPTSVTQALILAKAGAQDGDVVGATKISPSCN